MNAGSVPGAARQVRLFSRVASAAEVTGAALSSFHRTCKLTMIAFSRLEERIHSYPTLLKLLPSWKTVELDIW